MSRKGLVGLLVAVCLFAGAGSCAAARIGAPQTPHESARDVFLQTIGMLAGQGLVLGHECLEGIFARYEQKALTREAALQALEGQTKYVNVVLAVFQKRLMGQLTTREKKDLTLLVQFYNIEAQATAALTDYVRETTPKNREAFQKFQGEVETVIRQIRLGTVAP